MTDRISDERLRELIAECEAAKEFRLRSHDKIVPMGAGEMARIIAALRELLAAREQPVAWRKPKQDGSGFHYTETPLPRGYEAPADEQPLYAAPPAGQEWPAKLRLTELLREAANALEACHAANEDLLNRRAARASAEGKGGE